MGTQLGEALIPIRAVLDKLDGDLAQARGKVEGAMSGIAKIGSGIGESLQKVGKLAMGGIGAGIAGITAIITGATAANISWAETLDNIGDVLGTTTQQSAALAVAVQHIGGNTDQLTSQLAFMSRGLETADGKLGPTGEALKGLGINFRDAQGQIRPATDILQDVADKIGAMPDGLEKTSLMMDVFGKSGKDMSDLMGAVANGGMAAFDQKAKDLGLSMSQDAVDGAIALNRSLKDIKMAAQGALVSLGTALLPIIKPLAEGFLNLAMKGVEFLRGKIALIMPVIQGIADAFSEFFSVLSGGDLLAALDVGIMDLGVAFGMSEDAAFNLAAGVGNIIETVRNAISAVIDFLTPIWEAVTSFVSWKDVLVGLGIVIASVIVPAIIGFIAGLAPIIATIVAVIAVVSLLRHAWESDWQGIQEKAAAVWAWLQVAFGNIKEWLAVAIPKAIQILSDFWTTVLQPAIAAVWNWLSTVLIPFLANEVFPWLAVAIPKAIQVLSDFWATVLWPAMQAVWGFIKNSLIPIFLDVVGWLQDNIPKAIAMAKTSWEEHLKPALEKVWTFIKEHLWPAFLDVGTWLLTTIGTAITAAAGFWENTLKPALYKVWLFIYNDLLPRFKDVYDWLSTAIGGAIEVAKIAFGGLKTAFETIRDFVKDHLLPGFTDVYNFFKDTFETAVWAIATAFDGISSAISTVIGWIQSVITELGKIKLPDWLTPGSPTPFEMGLRGIAKQLQAIDQLTGTMPLFNGLGASMPALAMAGAETSQYNSGPTSYSATTTIYTNRDPLRVLHAARHLDRLGSLK